MEIKPLELDENYDHVLSCLKEIQQSRTNYQLKRFVVGQHDTPQQQYKQVLLELQSLIFTVQEIELQVKKQKLQILKLESTNDEIDLIEAEISRIQLTRTGLALAGAKQELQGLMNIWNSFEHKYTREEIENDQEVYWEKRLTRQAELEYLGSGKVGWGSLDSLLQINKLENVMQVKPAPVELEE